MTTIGDLPEEILLLIFQHMLFRSDMKNCQKVCRSWYLPAHILFLEDLILHSKDEICRFIASIDHNPHPSYLKAVNTIDIINYNGKESEFLFTKQDFYKLFCRFPNLKSVKVYRTLLIFESFDEQMCMDLLASCPKLDTFEIDIEPRLGLFDQLMTLETQEEYCNALFKWRLLLSKIRIEYIDFTLLPNSPIDFITRFPRLEEIEGVPRYLDNFEKILPAFTRMTNLKTIAIRKATGDQDGFEERYLATKTTKEQELFVKTLSTVSCLDLRYYHTAFSTNSIKFVTKYFKNLDVFTLCSYGNNENMTDLQKTLFCNDIVNLVCSAKKAGCFYFKDIKLTNFIRYFPTISPVLFQDLQAKKLLRLNIRDTVNNSRDLVNIQFNSDNQREQRLREQRIRELDINVSHKLSLRDLHVGFFSAVAPINLVDTFTLEYYINDCTENLATTVNDLDEILDTMPSLKKLTLKIPDSYIPGDSHGNVYPLVEKLSLRTSEHVDSEELLKQYSFKFPNLNGLKIFYYSGIYNEKLGEFKLVLPNYSLKRLAVDLTDVKTKIWQIRDIFKKNCVLVIQVNENLLFKLDLKRNTALETSTSITKDDLHGLISGKDYIKFHLVIPSLRHLDVYINDSFYATNYARDAGRVRRITLFDHDKALTEFDRYLL